MNSQTSIKMDSIKTYVFFDLESTGLSAARVTEVSLVAVHHQELTSFSKMFSMKMSSESDKSELCWLYPRVMNKLTLAVNPVKPVNLFVEQLTGLSNYNLEHQPRFRDGAGPAMVSFVASLCAPVCLVAHNGNRFDFPLLMKELKLATSKLGSDASHIKMPDDLLCCDSFKFFQWFYKDASKTKPAISAKVDNNVTVSEERNSDHDSKVVAPNFNCDLAVENVEEPTFGTPTKSVHLDSSPFMNTPVKTPGQKEVKRVLYETPSKFSTPRSSPAKSSTETVRQANSVPDSPLQGLFPLPVKPSKLSGIQDLMDILVKDDEDLTEFSDNDDDCFNDSFEDCIDSQVLLESFQVNNEQEQLVRTNKACLKIETKTIVIETGAGDGQVTDLNDSFNTPPSSPCKQNRIQPFTPPRFIKAIPTNSPSFGCITSTNKALESQKVKPLSSKTEQTVETKNTTSSFSNNLPVDESVTKPKRRKGRGSKSSSGDEEESIKPKSKVKPPSLSLPNLYKYMFGRLPVQSHGAEVDCLSLLQVVAAIHPNESNNLEKDTFQEWANNNSQLLKDVKSMA